MCIVFCSICCWFTNGGNQVQELKRLFKGENPVRFCTCTPCVGVVLLFPWLIIFHWVFTLPLPGHFTSTICWRQMQRGWFSGWFNVWYSPWKQNSFPGRATLESQQGDMKQSQVCDALPQYPLPFHSHILRFYQESIFPLPHSEVTPAEILHLLSLPLPGFLFPWWMSSTLWGVSACPSCPAIRN